MPIHVHGPQQLCLAGCSVKVPQQTWGFSERNRFKGNCSWKAITYIEFGINRQADRVFLAALCLSKQILDNASFLAKRWVSGWRWRGSSLDFHSPHLTRDHTRCLHPHIWKGHNICLSLSTKGHTQPPFHEGWTRLFELKCPRWWDSDGKFRLSQHPLILPVHHF